MSRINFKKQSSDKDLYMIVKNYKKLISKVFNNLT